MPLFVEELTKAVLEAGLLQKTEAATRSRGRCRRWRSRQRSRTRHGEARPPGARQKVAQVAACIGREFSYELLAAVVGWGEQELTGALRHLVAAELVFHRDRPTLTHIFFDG